jgi:Electron transfer DM13
MKLKQLVPFSFVSAIAFTLSLSTHAAQAFTPVTSGGQYSQQLQANSDLSQTRIFAQANTVIAATGTFMAAEKPTVGTAQVVVEKGMRYLVFDSAFQTSDQGPDLQVVLDSTNQPPAQYQDPTQYINLGKLQKFSGAQRYLIPASVDLNQVKSVGIWCRMANATFGYATLQSSVGTNR